MAELSNAVTVLIARMESHPEDFDHSATTSPKFGFLADYLTKLAGGGDSIRHRHPNSFIEEPFWFLTDADKEALIAAWRKYHYVKFEAGTMKKIFDDGEAEREVEELKRKMQHQMHVMQQQAYQQQAQMPQPVTALNNASSLAGSGNYYNGGGLLGSVGSALGRIF